MSIIRKMRFSAPSHARMLQITYNEQSVMDNHHLAATFRLLARPEYNFMDAMPAEEQAMLRSSIIAQVLATDMKSHFNTVSRFQAGVLECTKTIWSHFPVLVVIPFCQNLLSCVTSMGHFADGLQGAAGAR